MINRAPHAVLRFAPRILLFFATTSVVLAQRLAKGTHDSLVRSSPSAARAAIVSDRPRRGTPAGARRRGGRGSERSGEPRGHVVLRQPHPAARNQLRDRHPGERLCRDHGLRRGLLRRRSQRWPGARGQSVLHEHPGRHSREPLRLGDVCRRDRRPAPAIHHGRHLASHPLLRPSHRGDYVRRADRRSVEPPWKLGALLPHAGNAVHLRLRWLVGGLPTPGERADVPGVPAGEEHPNPCRHGGQHPCVPVGHHGHRRLLQPWPQHRVGERVPGRQRRAAVRVLRARAGGRALLEGRRSRVPRSAEPGRVLGQLLHGWPWRGRYLQDCAHRLECRGVGVRRHLQRHRGRRPESRPDPGHR